MKILLPFLSLVLFLMGTSAEAASLYMDPNVAEINRGDTIKVSIRVDTAEDECINAIDGVITYSENIQPLDTSRGSSILSMWVEEPVINKEKRTITFAGGIPNGYCGRIPGDPRLTNNIVDLVFQSPGLQIGSTESGDVALIGFAPETQVYLNDGFGTIASTSFFGATFQLSKKAGNNTINTWQESVTGDEISPEKFSIALERTTNAFSNDYFIVFNTTDKQSGIDHYEVIEEPLTSKNLFGWGAETAPWITVKSPYVIDDQSLNSTIRVKAIDKAGNEYIATYVPDEEKRTVSEDTLYTIGALTALGVVCIAGLIVAVYMYRRRKAFVVQKTGIKIENEK